MYFVKQIDRCNEITLRINREDKKDIEDLIHQKASILNIKKIRYERVKEYKAQHHWQKPSSSSLQIYFFFVVFSLPNARQFLYLHNVNENRKTLFLLNVLKTNMFDTNRIRK